MVLPTPPFWLAMAMTRAAGAGRQRLGRRRLQVPPEPTSDWPDPAGLGSPHHPRLSAPQPAGRQIPRPAADSRHGAYPRSVGPKATREGALPAGHHRSPSPNHRPTARPPRLQRYCSQQSREPRWGRRGRLPMDGPGVPFRRPGPATRPQPGASVVRPGDPRRPRFRPTDDRPPAHLGSVAPDRSARTVWSPRDRLPLPAGPPDVPPGPGAASASDPRPPVRHSDHPRRPMDPGQASRTIPDRASRRWDGLYGARARFTGNMTV